MSKNVIHLNYDVLKSSEEIRLRIQELGRQITADYAGEDLVVIGVLKGAFMFMADLVRCLDMPVTCDFLRVSSYGDHRQTSGEVKLELDVSQPVTGKHVLLVEDIVDTGLTLQYLHKNLATRKPLSVRVCTFLHKRDISGHLDPEYVGFSIPSDFVVGYGLDLAGRFRNLPFLAAVQEQSD